MHIHSIELTHFRNYARLELYLPARIHVFRGDNAQGKTNLLEAVYYASTTRSRLASHSRELVGWSAIDEVLPHAEILVSYVRGGVPHNIRITLLVEGDAIETSRIRRQIMVDGVRRRAIDVVGLLNVVLFLPEDIVLVAGAPAERRRFLDILLCQVDRDYCRSLSRYNRTLTQRNALLKRIRDRQAGVEELSFWDQEIMEHGVAVLRARMAAVDALSGYIAEIHPELTGKTENLLISYRASVMDDGSSLDASLIEPCYAKALQRSQWVERARGVTVVGPHRDDLGLIVNGRDVVVYGSRGQQRTVALALKLAEIDLMKARTGESPVLLLDDVASELDTKRCGYILDRVSRHEQVLITTTDMDFFPARFLQEASLWEVEDGSIRGQQKG